jgi:membrane associated rhomboid family serine protease
MATQVPTAPTTTPRAARGKNQREGLILLVGIVALMWAIEAINSLDSGRLADDGIYPRNVDRLWGILTAPFLHVSFQHLIDNTVPLVFMGAIIALSGALSLARVTLFVIVIGGLGTWLIAPSGSDTVGASGLVFGYATFLMARGFINRSALELVAGVIVGVVWGAALLSSLVPHNGVSWQAHLCGAIAGVLAAWALSQRRRRRGAAAGGAGAAGAAGGAGGVGAPGAATGPLAGIEP